MSRLSESFSTRSIRCGCITIFCICSVCYVVCYTHVCLLTADWVMLSGQLWQQKQMTGDGLSGSVLNIDIEVYGIELHLSSLQ